MGKPGPTTDRSCSGYIPRYIVHRVAMSNPRTKDNPDAIVPKMAKQNFAFSAGLRTRILTWKVKPLEVHQERNKLPLCDSPWAPAGVLCRPAGSTHRICTCQPGTYCVEGLGGNCYCNAKGTGTPCT